MEEKKETVIAGRNPVLEALRSEQELESVYIQQGDRKGSLGKIVAMARQQGVPVKEVTGEKLQALSGISSHQGVAAVLSAGRYATLEDVYARAGEEPHAGGAPRGPLLHQPGPSAALCRDGAGCGRLPRGGVPGVRPLS